MPKLSINRKMQNIVVRFCGDSGDGMQLTGNMFSSLSAILGHQISTLPDWPSVHIWYYPRLRYETGVSTITDDTGAYRIYDIEKTVTDILYYRNKVGIEETKEILTNYLKREDRDLVRLHRYADSLGCGKILATYLEVLL